MPASEVNETVDRIEASWRDRGAVSVIELMKAISAMRREINGIKQAQAREVDDGR